MNILMHIYLHRAHELQILCQQKLIATFPLKDPIYGYDKYVFLNSLLV